ncbi:hypothetical protein NDU88_009978 [Pleurodeles waltl]|uniref:Uncharacterized protein n=1 Tax=Pleurodeles waltl TaxID=8319 RepID=A0AAV7PYQ5_PLEWA|nr:hypothetical protein NDU88_009978 [Pleurodeles waltl]
MAGGRGQEEGSSQPKAAAKSVPRGGSAPSLYGAPRIVWRQARPARTGARVVSRKGAGRGLLPAPSSSKVRPARRECSLPLWSLPRCLAASATRSHGSARSKQEGGRKRAPPSPKQQQSPSREAGVLPPFMEPPALSGGKRDPLARERA